MQVYVICTVLLWVPSAFGLYALDIDAKFAKYRDHCIEKAGVTNDDLISQIKSRNVPQDGSADTFAFCMLQTLRVLNEDGTVNKDIPTYYLLTTRNRFEIAEECVPRSGSVGSRRAMTIFKCLENNGVVVLPYIN